MSCPSLSTVLVSLERVSNGFAWSFTQALVLGMLCATLLMNFLFWKILQLVAGPQMNAITMQSADVPQTVLLNVHVIKDSLEMDLLVKVPLLLVGNVIFCRLNIEAYQ